VLRRWVPRILPGASRTYATALVDALDFLCGDPLTMPPLASGIGNVADLKRRLTMILRETTPPALGHSGADGAGSCRVPPAPGARPGPWQEEATKVKKEIVRAQALKEITQAPTSNGRKRIFRTS